MLKKTGEAFIPHTRRAWVVDKNSNARLKVSFFWPFRGDYWIFDLGREYEYAVVGTPNRRYLWILSRTPEIHPDILEKIVQNAEKQGFVRSNLLLHNNGTTQRQRQGKSCGHWRQ